MPFHTGFLRPLPAPTRPAKARLKPVEHQHRQRCRRPRRLLFAGRSGKPGLHLGLGFGPEPLRQGADRGVLHRIAEFGRRFIRRGHGPKVSQLVFQRRTELLVGAQPPVFPLRTAPVAVNGILSAPHLQPARTEGRAQAHRLLPPVLDFASALGGKLRRGGWLGLAAFAAAAGASIPGLRLPLPTPNPVVTQARLFPCSSEFLSFVGFLCR